MMIMYASPLIALLTDFGVSETYVGSMKGVISQIAPGLSMVDLTHEIPPGDIRRAAIDLWKEKSYFPQKTIFLSVVDPGVGTSRRAILVHSNGFYYIGPDNGLFSYILSQESGIWELTNPLYQLSNPSTTFHGRDIFAPAAAHLARGIRHSDFGPQVLDPIRLPYPFLDSPKPETLRGEILYPDRFGNLLTSLGRFQHLDGELILSEPWVPREGKSRYPLNNLQFRLSIGTILPWANTFEEIPSGKCAVVLGSSGLLEIVAYRQSAKRILEIRGDETIILETTGGQ